MKNADHAFSFEFWSFMEHRLKSFDLVVSRQEEKDGLERWSKSSRKLLAIW